MLNAVVTCFSSNVSKDGRSVLEGVRGQRGNTLLIYGHDEVAIVFRTMWETLMIPEVRLK